VQAALRPEGIEVTRKGERRLLADVPLVDLAVVADLAHDLLREVGRQAQPGVERLTLDGLAEEALDLRVVALEHLVDVLRRDLELLRLHGGDHGPVDGVGPVVVAISHDRPERLLRHRLLEDDEALGAALLLGEVRAHAGELRLVRRPGAAALLDERLLERLVVLERQRLVVDAERLELRLEVELRRRPGEDADRLAVHILQGLVAGVGPDHHPLAVVEGRVEEPRALGAVARGRPRRVADEHVHLPRLQRGEALLGGQRPVLDRLGVAEDGRRDDAAEVDVEALEVARLVLEAEARHGVVDAAVQRAAVLDLLEEAAALAALTALAFRFAGLHLAPGVAALVGVEAATRQERNDGEHDPELPDPQNAHQNTPLLGEKLET
jgi:hypothetical protein